MTAPPPAPPLVERLALVLRRAVSLLLPRRLRTSAPEMEAAFQAMVSDARERSGPRGVLAVTLREVVDLVRAAVDARRPRSLPGPTELAREFRLALRTLLRSPVFTGVAALTVAVGVGGATAMAALVHGVLLRPLPYATPERLAHVFLTIPDLGWDRGPISGPNFDDLRRRAMPFESLAAYQMGIQRTLMVGDAPHRVVGTAVSGEWFTTLGVEALRGRTLGPADEVGGGEPAVVLSHALWTGTFGGDEDVVGRRVLLGDRRYTVVGVMPSDFLPLYRPSTFWIPFPWDVASLDRDQNFLTVLGRLRPGVSVERAGSAVEAVVREMEAVDPEGLEGRAARVESRTDVVTGDVRGQLFLFLGAIGLVLVIVCANLAGLLLTRGISRRRELAVRRALGARRARIVRERMAESLGLSFLGLVLALPLAWGVLEVVRATGPADLPRLQEVQLTPLAWIFAAVVAASSALAFGVIPALRASRGDLVSPLKEGGVRAGGAASRLQRGLVVTQVALTVVLLTGTGLLAGSLLRLQAVETGFRPEGVLTFRIEPPAGAYTVPEEQDAFYREIVAGVSAIPGVTAVGAGWALPFGANFGSSTYQVDGRPDEEEHLLQLVPVRGDWFEAMGIELLAGRRFLPADADATDAPPVIVSRSLADAVWPGESAVGKRLRKGSGEAALRFEVIGVVPDLTMGDLGEEPRLLSFWPHAAVPWARDLYVVVRADADPLALVPAARETVRRVDERVPLAEVTTLAGLVDEQLTGPRFRTGLSAGFAIVAVLLALLGVYGVTSFVVAGRAHEIGVRMALGAPARRVRLGVLGWGAGLAAPGIAVGLLLAVLVGRRLEGLLFRTSAGDVEVYAGVVIVTLLATLSACWVPAHRASSVDPTEALRTD